MRADLARSRGARRTARWVKVAVGGLTSLLQWIGRGASRQRLHIISGRHKLRAYRSWAAGIPVARQAWQPAAGFVVDTVWMVESAARVALYGGQELATLTIPPGGYGPRRELDHLWVSLTGSVSDAVRLEETELHWAGLAWHRHCVNSVSGVLAWMGHTLWQRTACQGGLGPAAPGVVPFEGSAASSWQAQATVLPSMNGVDSGRRLWQLTGTRRSCRLVCRGLRSGSLVSTVPISHQQCYPSWACNWIRPAAW